MTDNYIIGWSQDQHNLHRRLKANKLRAALEYGFPSDETTSKLAMLFYGGDFWDHLADSVQNDEFQDACSYIGWRCQSAAKWGYPIRVLKGTTSHDMDQAQWWVTINDMLETPCDLKYVDTVMVESHPVLGDILYVPDNWKPTADEVWEDVCEVLRAKNLKMVDWIIMHGAFKHQLPEHLHNKVHFLHDSERYSSICRKYVLVGHVHLYSQWKNIISCGSLDRLSFGEEAPKGMLKIHVKPEGDDILFIENPYARTMATYDHGLNPDIDHALKWLDAILTKADQDYCSIRFKASKLSELAINVPTIEKLYPKVEFVFQATDEKEDKHQLVKLDSLDPVSQVVDLSNSNIKKLLMDRIGTKMNDSIQDKIGTFFS